LIKMDDVEAFNTLVERGLSVERLLDHAPLLSHAVMYGSNRIFDCLLEMKADVNQAIVRVTGNFFHSEGKSVYLGYMATPIYFAIAWGRYDMALVLLEKGAKLDGVKWNDPITLSVQENQLEIAKAILTFGGPSLIRYEAIELAISKQLTDFAITLLRAKPSLVAIELSGLLFRGIIHDMKEVSIELFHNFNAEIDPYDDYERYLIEESVLMRAVRWEDIRFARMIIEKGVCDIFFRDNRGRTALDIAMGLGLTDMAEMITSYM
jgi:hypothetical protein